MLTPIFENARVRVCDLRLPALATASFLHAHPTVRWQVDAGMHSIDGSEPAPVKDKTVAFSEAGTHFNCQNVGGADYRQIWFEIKQPPKRTEEEVQELLERAKYSTEVGTELLFENRYCRAWDFFLEPGAGDPKDIHHHVLDYCFVYVAPGRLLGSHADGRLGLFDSINVDNDVTWFDIPNGAADDDGFAHGGKNGYEDRSMREYLLELK
tara:strand:+ start:225 stop:854 length:630 start_codon:yes stop_codon:yes gene_type:complete